MPAIVLRFVWHEKYSHAKRFRVHKVSSRDVLCNILILLIWECLQYKNYIMSKSLILHLFLFILFLTLIL